MPKVVLLSVDPLPFPDPETPMVGAALQSLGIDSQIIGWSDPALLDTALLDPALLDKPADAYVVRSTWNYHELLPEFLETLRRLPAPVLNPIPVIEWNCHKGYLVELATAGVPVIPTVLVRRGDVDSLPELPFDTAEVIIKPASSAGAIGVGRFRTSDPAALHHLRELVRGADALIQPFVPGIADGERSLLYFGGELSHAVRKVPTATDFRVQHEYGGRAHPYLPTEADLRVARAAMDCAPGEVAYARVDLVETADGPQIMELELIEPELFLTGVPEAADRLARVIAAQLPESRLAR